MYFSLITLAALAVTISAAETSTRHVVHEKRDVLHADWAKTDRVSSLILPVKIGLTQSNLDRGHDELMKVSDPDSPEFGKHWTLDEITDFFAPSQESVDSVSQWLSSAGIHPSRISRSKSLGWLKFDANVEEVESLLKTRYHYYKHTNGASGVGCEEYSVPEHVQKHIDFIMPTTQFDSHLRYHSLQKRTSSVTRPVKQGNIMGGPVIERPESLSSSPPKNSSCDTQITPACLRTLYGLPKGKLDLSSYGIVEYENAVNQTDLNTFFGSPEVNDAKVPVGTSPIFKSINGGYLPPLTNGESDLDLEYAMTLVWPQKVTLYQVGDNGTNAQNSSFGNFLDALDASYCTPANGENPNYEETFPDPGPGGYSHQDCGTQKATAVIAQSYYSSEAFYSIAYAKRQCQEYMKLSMAGTSFLFASGDAGVADGGNSCKNRFNHTFGPSFPSTCPYVTSVGGTQLSAGTPPTGPEVALETYLYSSGGFSDIFSLPSWQKAAVHNYYAKYPPPYTSAQYNNSQRVRGFPDVSANGANYLVADGGSFGRVFGTSASTPTFGAVITFINNERAQLGKGPLGFLNPMLYANPGMFNDIVSGNNPGCGTKGFTAVPGWDPITGLGTPNYEKMKKYLVSLP